MAVAKVYQDGQWVPLADGAPDLVNMSTLNFELDYKADFDHNHGTFASCVVHMASAATTSGTKLAWSSAPRNDYGLWVSGANTRVTIKNAGWYLCSFTIQDASTSTVYRYYAGMKNNTFLAGAYPGNHEVIITVSSTSVTERLGYTQIVYCVPGDYLEVYPEYGSGTHTCAATFSVQQMPQ